jgi:hypothetical protein
MFLVHKAKQLIAAWRAELARRRDLAAKLENLTDPTFLARAVKDEVK